VVCIAGAWLGAASASAASVTSLIAQGKNPSISANGRFIAYESPDGHIYLRDTLLGTTEQVDVSTAGVPANDYSYHPEVSAHGRYVMFGTAATNLFPHDTNQFDDVVIRDRKLHTTSVVPKVTTFVFGAWFMSTTGRYVVYSATGHDFSIYRYDRKTGKQITSRVGNDQAAVYGVSNDGRSALVWGTGTGYRIWKPLTNRFHRFDQALGGGHANGEITADALSADGSVVLFDSNATNLVYRDTNGKRDVFVRDLASGTTRRVSVGGGRHTRQANSASVGLALSTHGDYALFSSAATNLVPGVTNKRTDLFLRDRVHHRTRRCSVSTTGKQANRRTPIGVLSGDGAFVAFASDATNLVPNDNDGVTDVFLRGPSC
jgi:Tol biopolymer transport system component